MINEKRSLNDVIKDLQTMKEDIKRFVDDNPLYELSYIPKIKALQVTIKALNEEREEPIDWMTGDAGG